MSPAEEIKQLKAEIRELKEFRLFLLKHLKLEPTQDELEQAVAIFVATGDKSGLDSYIVRGGPLG